MENSKKGTCMQFYVMFSDYSTRTPTLSSGDSPMRNKEEPRPEVEAHSTL